jgi:EAL domain-containing protein (putative c-di-GMP-specific phosphodiesterase class I)
MGIATGPEQADDADELFRYAETAVLSALETDSRYAMYSQNLSERAIDSLALELDLELAIKRGEFELCYQPKVATDNFLPCGAEGLLRWTHSRRGAVSPDIFIPIADRTGSIHAITYFVLNTALRQAGEWPTQHGDLSVSINATPKVIENLEFAGTVASAIQLWNFNPERLIVEITESAIMNDPGKSFRVLTELRDIGVKIAIDDFGTGYSSLAYFKNIPADELKIDKSFVINMLENSGDRQIIRAVIELSRGFGLQVTAEGVEDAETARTLADIRCDCLQGFYYSKALPHRELIGWLNAYSASPKSLAV